LALAQSVWLETRWVTVAVIHHLEDSWPLAVAAVDHRAHFVLLNGMEPVADLLVDLTETAERLEIQPATITRDGLPMEIEVDRVPGLTPRTTVVLAEEQMADLRPSHLLAVAVAVAALSPSVNRQPQ
jgi:hypothetical protein